MKENLIPIMTSNTKPSGKCTADSIWSSGCEFYRAFDNKLDTMWIQGDGHPAWISYTFEKPTTVNEVFIISNKNNKINWEKADIYGDGSFLDSILKSEMINVDSNFVGFNKKFKNSNEYSEYKIDFNTTKYVYIREIKMFYNKPCEYLLKQNNHYYTIRPEFYNNGQLQPITDLDGKLLLSKEDYEKFGFDDLNALCTVTDTIIINGIDKGKLDTGKYFELELNNDVKNIKIK